jgi:RNA polymerase sigma factor (sigma-70 family)
MANALHGTALRYIHALYNVGTFGELTDGQLLERFTANTGEAGEAGELAFAALVERHGPMVLRVCRSVLREPDDAQDAFQATFLVLVRKASSIRNGDSLASWLHGVAFRTAACARAARARRLRHERKAAETTITSVGDGNREDLAPVLHEELDRLAEKYREPIVLCYLEGLTHEQTARQLRWPVGTVRSRLARGRDQLRGRLKRRGLSLSAGLWGVGHSAEAATAAFPGALAAATVTAAVRFTSGRSMTSGMVSSSVALLTEGALREMFISKIKFALLACSLVTTGAVVVGQQVATRSEGEIRQAVTRAVGNDTDRPTAQDVSAAEATAVAREVDQLDLELLDEEVQQLRDRVKLALRDKIRAERRNPGGSSEGSSSQTEGVKEAQVAYQASRASYMAKARELRSRRGRMAMARGPSQAVRERSDDLTTSEESRAGGRPSDKEKTHAVTAVGSVDMDKVFSQYERARHAREQYRAWTMAERGRLGSLADETKELENKLARLVSGTPDFLALEGRITALKVRYEGEREMLTREASQREARTMSDLYRDIQDAIAAAAKLNGLDYVVKVSPRPEPESPPHDMTSVLNRSVIYANPRNDLTEEIIRDLNRRFEAAGAGKPR